MSNWEIREGDSLSLLRTLEAESVDALVTDPPYSSGGQYRGDRMARPNTKYQRSEAKEMPHFDGDNRDQRGMLAWCSLWLSEAWRACKPGAPFVLFSDWRMLPTMTDAVQAGGFTWRGIVPWHKTNPRRQIGRFAAACEFAIWGSKGAMPLERGVAGQPGWVTSSSIPTASRRHMTEKPVDVMRHLVKICAPGGLVLDPFTGSGSTGEGALLEGRRFLGFEMSAEYAQIARDRLAGVAVPEAA